jgi:translation initiation factor IF-2
LFASQVNSEQQARVACDRWKETLQNKRQQAASPFPAMERETEKAAEAAGGTITVPLIIKGDVAGSVEALVDIIESRNPEKFELKILQSGVGAINESDIEMADSSKGTFMSVFGNFHRKIFCSRRKL